MKIIIGILLVMLLGIAVFFFVKRIPSLSEPQSTPNIEVTLTGTLTEVAPASEYSFVLKGEKGQTGINSMKVNLKMYSNKKVVVTGQYSGSVLYADTVTEIQ